MINNQPKIEKLIIELCPDGVELKELGEVTIWDKRFNGVKKSKQAKTVHFKHVSASELKNLQIDNGYIKLLATGKFNGWTTKEFAGENLNNGEVITIPSGGSANLKYYNCDFVDSGNILAIAKDESINLRYVYYFLLTKNRKIESYFKGSGVKHPSMKKVLEMKIPLPPLAIQEEIVKILNSFTELETELEARKKQYEYYREELLTFGDDINCIPLNELCKIGDGLHGTPKYTPLGKYYFINGNNLKKGHLVFEEHTKKVGEEMYIKHGIEFFESKTLFMSINGTIGSVAFFRNENIVLGKSVAYFNLKSDSLNLKFLYYLLQTTFAKNYYEAQKTGATIKNLGLKALREFKIPIPPLPEQERIVSILDKFDALVNDISIGLPAELKARRQQYEYYRGKLLTFKSL